MIQVSMCLFVDSTDSTFHILNFGDFFFKALFVKKKLVRDWLVWTWLVRFPKGLVMDLISIECSLDFLIFWTESDCWFMFGYCCYVIINYCYYYSLWLLDCYYLLLYIVIIIWINPWNGAQDMLSTTHAPFSKPHFSKPGISGVVKQAMFCINMHLRVYQVYIQHNCKSLYIYIYIIHSIYIYTIYNISLIYHYITYIYNSTYKIPMYLDPVTFFSDPMCLEFTRSNQFPRHQGETWLLEAETVMVEG